MIDKRDLRLGNMFEQGIVWKISGRSGAKVHLHGKGKWYKGFRTEVSVEDLKPIPLTPKILTEWCGFDLKDDKCGLSYNFPRISGEIWIDTERLFVITGGIIIGRCQYIHELQNFYYAITKQELEIKG